MSDLISRQAAIDALEKILPVDPMRNEYTQGITCGAALATEYIEQLPSVQPERQVELVGTESNIEILSELRSQCNCFDEVEEPVYRALSDAIRALSAQSEIIRCKECVHADEYHHCDYMTVWNDGDCFCSYAERSEE